MLDDLIRVSVEEDGRAEGLKVVGLHEKHEGLGKSREYLRCGEVIFIRGVG